MFGNNKYMKWLFWGGIIGTSASLVWRMMDKRRISTRREKNYKFVRSLASKTMRGLRENLEDRMQQTTDNLRPKSKYLDKRLVGSSRWLKKNKTKWE